MVPKETWVQVTLRQHLVLTKYHSRAERLTHHKVLLRLAPNRVIFVANRHNRNTVI